MASLSTIRKLYGTYSSRLRSAAIVLADQAVCSGATFLTGVLVGRALSIGAFGEFSLGMSLSVFSLVLQDTLLATPYTFHVHNSPAERLPVLRAGALVQSLLLSLVGTVLLIAASLLVFPDAGKGDLPLILRALGLSLPFLFLRECLRRQLFAEFSMGSALKLDTVVTAIQFALLGAFWFIGIFTPAAVFAVMATAAGAGSAMTLFIQRSRYDFRAIDVHNDTRENILYGRWLLVGSICHLGSLYAYPWLVYLAHGKAAAGAFAACYSLVNLLNPLILGFNNYFRPKIMKTRADEGIAAMDSLVRRACLFLGLASVLLILFMFAAGGWLVRIVYGAEFSGLGTVIGIVSISTLPVFVGAPLQLGTLALNKPQINPKFHAASLAVTIIIGTPLVLFLGEIGAAAGYALAAATGCAVLARLYRKEVRTIQDR